MKDLILTFTVLLINITMPASTKFSRQRITNNCTWFHALTFTNKFQSKVNYKQKQTAKACTSTRSRSICFAQVTLLACTNKWLTICLIPKAIALSVMAGRCPCINLTNFRTVKIRHGILIPTFFVFPMCLFSIVCSVFGKSAFKTGSQSYEVSIMRNWEGNKKLELQYHPWPNAT